VSKKVYISGAITGVDDCSTHFADAEDLLIKKGYKVVNPYMMDFVMPNADYEDYMKVDLLLLDMCDAIYMLKGWENSRGANREYGYALAKGMEIMFEGE
jgi:nucleoside 2-deoxyribosyltransferase